MPTKRSFLAVAGLLAALLSSVVFSSCASSGKSYADSHPSLTAEQKNIVVKGKIPDGSAVAGMTKEDIRATMRGDPSQFTTVNGTEAWVYVRDSDDGPSLAPEMQNTSPGHMGGDPTVSAAEMDAGLVKVHTTVLFENGRATRAEVERVKP